MLRFIALGHTNTEIAEQLYLSVAPSKHIEHTSNRTARVVASRSSSATPSSEASSALTRRRPRDAVWHQPNGRGARRGRHALVPTGDAALVVVARDAFPVVVRGQDEQRAAGGPPRPLEVVPSTGAVWAVVA